MALAHGLPVRAIILQSRGKCCVPTLSKLRFSDSFQNRR
jgi:hypothetical protein